MNLPDLTGKVKIDNSQAVGAIKAVGEGATAAGAAVKKSGEDGSIGYAKMGASIGAASKLTESFLNVVAKIGPAIAAFVSQGSRVSEVERSFRALSTAQGISYDLMLGEGRAATKGLISDFNLMQQANRAMALGLPITAEGFGRLSSAAITLGQATGVTATEAVQRLIGGIGKMETELLDELGITVKATAAYDAYAASHGKVAEQLTDSERKVAYYNAALEQVARTTQKLDGIQLTTATRLEQLSVFWDNVSSAAGKTIAQSPTIGAALGMISESVEKSFGPGAQGYVGAFSDYLNRFGLGAVEVARWVVTAWNGMKMLGAPIFGWKATQADFTGTMNTLDELEARMKKSIEDQHANANKAGQLSRKAFDDGLNTPISTEKSFAQKLIEDLSSIPNTVGELGRAVRKSWEEGLSRAGYAPLPATSLNGVTTVLGESGKPAGWDLPTAQPGWYGGSDYKPGIATSIDPANLNASLFKDNSGAATAAEIQKQAAESAARWAGALQGVALIAGTIGGKLGDTLKVVGNIGEAFKGWDKMSSAGKFNAVAGGVGQIGGLIGGTAGGGIQGGAGGAMTGNALGKALGIAGPWGAIAGGALGFIGGLFGASSAQKKELADTKKQLEGLSETAQKFGIDLTKAFSSKSVTEVKQAISDVGKAVEDQKKRLAGLDTASGGLNAFSKGGGLSDAASVDRGGLYAGAIFGGMVKETGDVVGALKAIGPALAEMSTKAAEFGVSLSPGVANLLGMNDVISKNEGLADQVSGLNSMMKGLGEAGMVTKDLFAAFGQDTSAVFAKLVEGGATGHQALALMQPTLQQLYEGQKLHGFAVDEATQGLLDQAKAEGIVGEQFMSANERIVELLGILIETMGGTLPLAYQKAGDAAEEFGRRATSSAPKYPSGGGFGGGGLNYDGSPDGDGDPSNSFAGGTSFRNFGAGTRAVLHGEEAVLTRPQMDRLVGMAVAGVPGSYQAAPSGGGVQVGELHIHANDAQGGREAADAVLARLAEAYESGGPGAMRFRSAQAGR